MKHVTNALWGAALAVALPAAQAAAEPVTLRISTAAVAADWHAKMLTVMKDSLEDSGSDVTLEIHLGATLFKQGAEPIAMQRGNLDMALISAQEISKQIPDWSIFTAGYLIRDPEHQQAVFNGPIGEEMFGLVSEQMNIHVLGPAYLGTRQLNLRGDRRVETPADLDGVKLRMPGAPSWQFLGRALGANPTPMAFTEVYTALQTGTVDGQDNPLPTVKAAKFYEVTDQIILTGHLVDAVFIAVANQSWDKLDDAQKAAMEEAAQAAIAYNNENRLAEEAELVAFFEEQGLDVYEPDVDAFRTRVQEAYLDSEFSEDWPEGLLERINAAGAE